MDGCISERGTGDLNLSLNHYIERNFMLRADQIISLLNLKPHPEEEGYFVETYRSLETIPESALTSRYKGNRTFATAIYYLLTPRVFSPIHRLQSDEIFHFYLGDPVEMLQLWPDGSGKILLLGSDILNGMQPQVVVPRGIWQGARLLKDGNFALIGTTVSPGFEFMDYESGHSEELTKSYPNYREWITALAKH
jgi:predicted cupin superfamily sugar epimerase